MDRSERITVRDSSLSALTQSVMCAEVGHLDLAYAYTGEAALMDLRDLNRNTGDGLHLASLAGAWIALVAGFGGLRDDDGGLAFRPRLPQELDALTFGLRHRGRRLRVRVDHAQATYLLREGGEEMSVRHDDEELHLHPGQPVSRPWSVPHSDVCPAPPVGREPLRRSSGR